MCLIQLQRIKVKSDSGDWVIIILNTIKIPKPNRILRKRIKVDGTSLQSNVASWSFYLPSLQIKLLHSFDGFCHCISKGAPSRSRILEEDYPLRSERYTLRDWRQIYKKEVSLRTAENYVSADRLYKAGIGPKVIDIVYVKNFVAYYNPRPTWTCGLVVENLYQYPRKTPTTENQLHDAGVFPDYINSCIRQQIHGYVSDLNSVLGVMPKDADSQVNAINLEFQNVINSGVLS